MSEAYYFGWSESQYPGCGYGISDPLEAPGPDGEFYQLKPAMAWAFRSPDWLTWDRVDRDVRFLFQGAYGDGAQARWEDEHARDHDEAGWRGSESR